MVATAFFACAASAAPPGNLAFVRDGDVWRASADGAVLQRVTNDGGERSPYRSPSQADDGTLIAVRKGRIHRFALNGRRLVAPGAAEATRPNARRGEIVRVSLSPDGTRVAALVEYPCPAPPAPPASPVTCRDLVVMPAASPSGAQTTVLTSEGDLTSANWASPERLVLSRNAAVSEIAVADPATPAIWVPEEGPGVLLRDPDVALGRLAVVRRDPDGSTSLRLFTAVSPLVPPALRCWIGGEGIANPTWSPDGNALAWQVAFGVVVAELPGAEGCPASARLVAASGRDPDWGPASLSPDPVAPTPAPPASDARDGRAEGAPATPGGTGGGGERPGGDAGGADPDATRVATVSAGPGPRIVIRLQVRARVTVTLTRRRGERTVTARVVRLDRRAGTHRVPLGRLARGTYRVQVSLSVAGGGTARLPVLRLVVR